MEVFIALDVVGKFDEGIVVFDSLEIDRFYSLLELLLDSLACRILHLLMEGQPLFFLELLVLRTDPVVLDLVDTFYSIFVVAVVDGEGERRKLLAFHFLTQPLEIVGRCED
jgi:hypothetical protein